MEAILMYIRTFWVNWSWNINVLRKQNEYPDWFWWKFVEMNGKKNELKVTPKKRKEKMDEKKMNNSRKTKQKTIIDLIYLR